MPFIFPTKLYNYVVPDSLGNGLQSPSNISYSGDDYLPSLESFLHASTTNKDQDIRLSDLAMVSRLANARQPVVDVSKSSLTCRQNRSRHA